MSLILEALRKSEAERRRGSTPDVAMELPPASLPRVRANPPWMLPAVAIGALALIVAWWWSQQDAATAGVPAVATARPAPASIDTPAPRVVMAPPTQASAVTSAPPTLPPVAAASQPAAAGIVEAEPMPVRPLPQPLPAPVEVAEVTDIDPTSLPPVKLSMHIWDASPGKRFVILDGQRMAEGDRNGEVTVVAIERDGVIVERKGARARVPLP